MSQQPAAAPRIWIWQLGGLLVAVAAGGTGYWAAGWQSATPNLQMVAAATSKTGAASAPSATRRSNMEGTPPAAMRSDAEAGDARTVVGGRQAGGSIDLESLWESSALSGAGTAGMASMASAGPESWRITGVYQTESGPSVIVTFSGNSAPRYLRVSDKLPNGASIVAILTDTITVRTKINNRWVLVSLDV